MSSASMGSHEALRTILSFLLELEPSEISKKYPVHVVHPRFEQGPPESSMNIVSTRSILVSIITPRNFSIQHCNLLMEPL